MMEISISGVVLSGEGVVEGRLPPSGRPLPLPSARSNPSYHLLSLSRGVYRVVDLYYLFPLTAPQPAWLAESITNETAASEPKSSQ